MKKKNILLFLFLFLFLSYSVRVVSTRYGDGSFVTGRWGLLASLGAFYLPFVIIVPVLEFKRIRDLVYRSYFPLFIYTIIITSLYRLIRGESLSSTFASLVPFVLAFFSYVSARILFSKRFDFTYVYAGLAIIYFLLIIQNLSVESVIISSLDSGGQRIGGAYIPLFLLPCMLLHKKKAFHVISFVAIFILLLISGRRGGFVALIIAAFLYLLLTVKANKKNFLFIVALGIAITFIYLNYGDVLFDSFTMRRFADNDGSDITSGRNVIYANVIDLILNSNIIQLFCGHGMGAVALYTSSHMTAHNDYLEILFDYGLIGFIFYIYFQIQIIKVFLRMRRDKSDYIYAFSTWCAIFFTVSFVSHIYEYPFFYLLTFFLGFVFALEERNRTLVIKNNAL